MSALLLAGFLAPTFTQKISDKSLEKGTVLVTEPITTEVSRANFPSSYRAERDPWANPIISCSLVSSSDFGYDQRKIYRLPSEPKEAPTAKKSCLRDPMANLLLKNIESGASTS